MLKLFYKIGELDFRQLMEVYGETNQRSGKRDYPNFPEGLRLLYAEQDFYQYLEIFFEYPDSVYAVWVDDGRYKAALRLEKYAGGLLVTALETHLEARRKGYATKLVSAVSDSFKKTLYSHVQKSNSVSLVVHEKCGFSIISNKAVFLDGSIQNDYYTMKRL